MNGDPSKYRAERHQRARQAVAAGYRPTPTEVPRPVRPAPQPSRATRIKEMWGRSTCELCGEPFKLPEENEQVGEFYDPAKAAIGGATGHVIAHAQCGIDAGLDLA